MFTPCGGIAISVAIFSYRLFDLEPIARDTLIEMLSDGVVVLDAQSRLVDANPEAQKIFAWPAVPVGQFAEQVMGGWVSQTGLGAVEKSLKFESQRTTDLHTTYYEVTISVLKSKGGARIGYLILVHDISDLKEVEYKLQELSLVDDLTGLTNRAA
ncbi:MAG: PAS domain-containing protein [Holophaga sp.]|nr:PAS domain-containing protein [Holophaga sp.]